MGDFPYLEWLARDYKQRGEKSGLWTDYLKVGQFVYRMTKAVRNQALYLGPCIIQRYFIQKDLAII